MYRAVPAVSSTPAPPAGSRPLWEDSPVPAELVTLFRDQLAVDVRTVPVLRGSAVSQRAAQLGARAFTQAGQVHLPHEAGSLDDRDTRALLAHELTHAVQQRVLGPATPTEESAEGRELEDVARTVEEWVRGTGSAPRTLLHRAAPARPRPQDPVPVADVLQRAEPEVVSSAGEPRTGDITAARSWSPETGYSPETATSPPAPAPMSSASEPAPVTWTSTDLSPVYQQIAELKTEVERLRGQRGNDHAVTGERFVNRLYQAIRSRLRAELIVDRERAGLLADFG